MCRVYQWYSFKTSAHTRQFKNYMAPNQRLEQSHYIFKCISYLGSSSIKQRKNYENNLGIFQL